MRDGHTFLSMRSPKAKQKKKKRLPGLVGPVKFDDWPAGVGPQTPTLLRVGDVLQVWERHDPDLCLIVGERERDGGPWPALIFPVGLADSEDPIDKVPFRHHIPADFAERAAYEGRIRFAADSWSTWTASDLNKEDTR